MPNSDEQPGNAIAETENYMVWEIQEQDGETMYHLELDVVTLHFFREQWEEFLRLMKDAGRGR